MIHSTLNCFVFVYFIEQKILCKIFFCRNFFIFLNRFCFFNKFFSFQLYSPIFHVDLMEQTPIKFLFVSFHNYKQESIHVISIYLDWPIKKREIQSTWIDLLSFSFKLPLYITIDTIFYHYRIDNICLCISTECSYNYPSV